MPAPRLAGGMDGLQGPALCQALGPQVYLGGCQNYGPFLDPCYNTAPNI